jgi:protein subunit release factor A
LWIILWKAVEAKKSETMFKKLEEVEKKFERLNQDLQAPGVANDQKLYRSLMKE